MFYSWDRCVLIPLVFFRPIRPGARIRLAKLCFHYLLSSWVRVALLLCVLEVALRLLSVQNRIGSASDLLVEVELRDAPGAPPFPLDKGKGKVNLIKYPGGSKYLKSAIQHALIVGPSKVGPSYGATFARCYRPPFGIRVWSPDILTSYVVSVTKMVCFFEVAFDNALRFPLHPFMKGVLQHFNVCPYQLSPNGWGILVGLLVFFRDRGLGIPSIALFLYLLARRKPLRASSIFLDVLVVLW